MIFDRAVLYRYPLAIVPQPLNASNNYSHSAKVNYYHLPIERYASTFFGCHICCSLFQVAIARKWPLLS